MFKSKLFNRILSGIYLCLMAIPLSVPSALGEVLPKPHRHMFMTSDNVRLVADTYVPAEEVAHPCVVLVHQLGKTNADMQPLIAPLFNEGFIVVNLDMRGHGHSCGKESKKIVYTQFKNEDWSKLPTDIRIVLHNLKTLKYIDVANMALVGASINANAAIIEAQNATSVKAIVALSPGMDFHGVKPESAMKYFHKPSLLIAARDDKYSVESATKLSKLDKKCSLDILPSGGHGGQLLVTHPELPKQIASWLKKAMK